MAHLWLGSGTSLFTAAEAACVGEGKRSFETMAMTTNESDGTDTQVTNDIGLEGLAMEDRFTNILGDV